VLESVTAPPPLAASQSLLLLGQLGGLLLLAVLLGGAARRCGLPAVVGELCVGVVLGPSLLGWLAPGVAAWLLPGRPEQFHLVDAIAQVGVVLLVGLTGVHLDLDLVRRRRSTVARVSGAGLVVPLGLGIGCGYLLPDMLVGDGAGRGVFAAFLGVALCVSAIPVIAKTLLDMGLLHRDIGQLTLAAAAVDDVSGWLMLSVVSAVATAGFSFGGLCLTVLAIAGVLLLAAVPGVSLVRSVLRRTTARADPGTTLAAVVVMILLSAALTQALGLEAVLGALVCGVVVAASGCVDLAWLSPLRTVVLSVLAPIFFAMAGLRMDLTSLADPPVLGAAVLVVLVAVAGKFVGAYLGAKASRLGRWEAVAIGAGINARGVVQVVVAMIGLQLGVLSTAAYTIIVVVAIVTSVMAPPILRLALNRVAPTPQEQVRLSTMQTGATTTVGLHDAHGTKGDPVAGRARA
jgi:Kef-type K+ transport system membrane component KefB